MKNFLTLTSSALTILLASSAFAHPGGHVLTCKSAKNSGGKQALTFTLQRSNGTGWYAPTFSVTVDGKAYEIATTDVMKTYGQTIHNSPLGVIAITAEDWDDALTTLGSFSVTAVPKTVKAYDHDGKLVKWSLKAESDDCNDANGKAKFKAVFHGFMSSGPTTDHKTTIPLDTELMDCELDYNSGMAC